MDRLSEEEHIGEGHIGGEKLLEEEDHLGEPLQDMLSLF